MFLFGQCGKAEVDEIPPELTLKKGRLYVDPVVQTAPIAVSTILALNNQYDKIMTEFKGVTRPTSITAYNSSVIEPIIQKDLPSHVFQWQSTKQPVMMVALFKEVVRVDTTTKEISNKDALVWLWTPPKNSIDPGQITFKEGQMVVWNKETQVYDPVSPAQTLPLGHYVWFVLAWEKQGINIIAASRELPIRIR